MDDQLTKEFRLGDALSVTTGRVITNTDGMRDVIQHVLGEWLDAEPKSFDFEEKRQEAIVKILEQFPQLIGIECADDAHLRHYMEEQIEKFGNHLIKLKAAKKLPRRARPPEQS